MAQSYDEVRAAFRWDIPERFNIASAICDRHVGSGRLAVIAETAAGAAAAYTFEQLQDRSRRLANALAGLGVGRGDRVGILLPQCVETVIAHLAAYRLGAVALPLFTLFGPEAIEYRLNDSGARVVVSNAEGVGKLLALEGRLAAAPVLISIEDRVEGRVLGWEALIEAGSAAHAMVETAAEDPALIVYTSGTTGNPKGVLHAHRMLLGHLPGVELPHGFFPQPGDRMWTPADWAWAGGLMDVMLPSLFHGVPVLAKRFAKFDPEEAFGLMARHRVRNVFMPPTALKMMRQVPRARERFDYGLRSVASGGERLGDEMLDWGRATFGTVINEFYGQTEANLTVGNCAEIMPLKEGSMGRAFPGHTLEVVDEKGEPVAVGEAGTIAVRAPDPVFFLRYWNKPEATLEKFRNGWLLTGDTGHRDEEGYFWFHGRNDDLIMSGGYRIGPTEIEDCLLGHPAVAMVAVVGVPDRVRGEVVKACVVLREGVEGDEALRGEMQGFVKSRLSGHEYPRVIEFRESLPMTITGKIRRKDLRDEGDSLMGRLFQEFAVGQRFRTPGRTITVGDIGAFAGLTGDYNPVHTDEVFAAATEFGGCIAHGPMGIGLAFGLASRLDLIDGTVVALLGVSWDFRAPMRAGDTIHALVEVTETRAVKRVDCGLLGLSIALVNQAGVVAQEGTARLLMRRDRLDAADWGALCG